MDPAGSRRTLIVANRTATTHLLLEEVERRADERPTTFVLLIPNVSSKKAADWTLEVGVAAVRKAASGPHGTRTAHVDGLTGGPDAFESIKDALADGSFEDVIISTLPKRRSEWLRRDLPRRVEQLNVPVTVITEPEDTRSFYEKYGRDSPGGGLGGIPGS
jgi:hypothetical protein